jgi:hypothetical protein
VASRIAFPWDEAPRYVIRDRDCVYGAAVTHRLRTMGIRDKPIAPGSPWQNGFAERLIGSIRRECVDHLVVLGEAHLRRILTKYATYYNELRTRATGLPGSKEYTGRYAEYSLARPQDTRPLPDGIDWMTGAATPWAALTAWYVLAAAQVKALGLVGQLLDKISAGPRPKPPEMTQRDGYRAAFEQHLNAVWLPRTQIRAYRWCSPPRIGCAMMSPNRSIGRV